VNITLTAPQGGVTATDLAAIIEQGKKTAQVELDRRQAVQNRIDNRKAEVLLAAEALRDLIVALCDNKLWRGTVLVSPLESSIQSYFHQDVEVHSIDIHWPRSKTETNPAYNYIPEHYVSVSVRRDNSRNGFTYGKIVYDTGTSVDTGKILEVHGQEDFRRVLEFLVTALSITK
jgi:hypothetical protein